MKRLFITLYLLIAVSLNAAIDSGALSVPGVYVVKKKSAYSTLKLGSSVSVLSSQKSDSSKYLRVKVQESNRDSILAELRANPSVELVAPQIFYKTHAPNDPSYSSQWYLPSPNGIDADTTWETYSSGNNTVIAVIDTGVDYNHADLVANIWRNSGEIPNNGIDDDSNGYIDDRLGYDFVDMSQYSFTGDNPQEDYNTKDNDPMDVYGHGTHVSGIAAAPINNGVGIAGVAHGAKIMCLRAGFAYGGGGSLENGAIAEAIDYAVANGADVINMSFGSYSTDPLISTSIATASSNGVILIASAGNDNTSVLSYPAAYPGVIAVGATDALRLPASFTNYNTTPNNVYVDIAAPGVNIYSTLPGNSYAAWQGTSMAAPVVAGVAALLKSAGTTLNKTEIETYLIATANTDSYGGTKDLGSGIINAFKVLDAHGVVSTQSVTSGSTGPLGVIDAYFAPNPVDLKEYPAAAFYISTDTDINSWTLKVYNSRGKKVRSVDGNSALIGFTYDCKDDDGYVLPSGVYYVIVDLKDVLGRSRLVKKKLVIVN